MTLVKARSGGGTSLGLKECYFMSILLRQPDIKSGAKAAPVILSVLLKLIPASIYAASKQVRRWWMSQTSLKYPLASKLCSLSTHNY